MSQPDHKDMSDNTSHDNDNNVDNTDMLEEKVEDKELSLEDSLPPNIREMLNSTGKIIKAVLLSPDGTSSEIDYDTTPSKQDAKRILGALPTIVGEYHEIAVIVIRGNFSAEELESKDNTIEVNKHELRWPFDNNKYHGNLLLYRIDDEGNAIDFKLDEYNKFYNKKNEDEKLRLEWEKQCEADPTLREPVSLARMFADSIRDGNDGFKPNFDAIDEDGEDGEEDDMDDDIDNDEGNNNDDLDLGELDEMNEEDMIGIDKLKEILEKQIRKDFATMHGSEPSGEMLSQLIEQNIEAMMQFEDDDDEDDIDYKPDGDDDEDQDDDNEDDDHNQDEDDELDNNDENENGNNGGEECGISGIESLVGEKRQLSKDKDVDIDKEERFQQIVLEKICEEYSKVNGTKPKGDELDQLLKASMDAMNNYFCDESSNDDDLYNPELDEDNIENDNNDNDNDMDDDKDNNTEEEEEEEDNDLVNNLNNNGENVSKECDKLSLDENKDEMVEENNNQNDQDMKDGDKKDVVKDIKSSVTNVKDGKESEMSKESGNVEDKSKDVVKDVVKDCNNKENVEDNGENLNTV